MSLSSLLQPSARILLGILGAAYALGGIALLMHSAGARRRELARRVATLRPQAPGRQGEPQPQPVFRVGAASAGARRAREFARLLRVPPQQAKAAFAVFRLALSLLLVFCLLLLGTRWHASLSRPVLLQLVGAGFGFGWLGPLLIIEVVLSRRLKAIEDGLPEAVELLIIAVEAGLALDDALERILGELRHSRPAIAEQLALTAADLKILPDRQLALGNLAQRVDLPSVRSVVTTLTQTMRYGTPLAQALRVVAHELRNDALLRLEERANKMPVLLTLPMVLFILPSLFLIVGGPAVLSVIKTVTTVFHH